MNCTIQSKEAQLKKKWLEARSRNDFNKQYERYE